MTSANLIESMEASAEEKVREIISKAHKDADEVKKSAEVKAKTIKDSYLENAIKSVEAEKNRQTYTAKTETKMNLIKAKDELLQKAFLETKKILVNFREDSAYKKSLKLMTQEAVHELEGEEVEIHVDKKDEDLCKQILKESNKNFEIVADIECAGGLNINTKDGKVVVSNTIESRTERAKELLTFEIFSILFGD
ncbi:MAG TPA: V-type ATP synthase subunit E [Candidatus Acidoferrum sp.]|nr:V-type ATP synthase subunit E [Candidatus Acidoferrum sp.]